MKCNPISPSEVPLYIFQMAESFSATLNVLSRADFSLAEVDAGVDVKALLTVPWIVSESFAVELYLKCLHAIEHADSIPRSHDLLALFQSLGVQQRATVTKRFKETQATNGATAHRAKVLGRRDSPTIEETLKESCRAFENFRYAWENDNRVNSFDLMNVRVAVRDAIVRANPKMRQIVKKMAMIATAAKPCGPDCRGLFAHLYAKNRSGSAS